ALGIPGATRAAELTFAIDGAVEYDSNVFRSHRDEKDDFIFRLRPWVRLAEERGQDLTYGITYALPVEFAVEHTEVDDVDQEFYGNLGYHVNDRFELYASNTLRYIRSELRTNFDGTEGAFDSPLVNDQRDRVTINDALLGATYQFTPRLGGGLQVSHDYFHPSRDDRQENWQIQGAGNLLYTITPRHRAGGGASVAYQKFYNSNDIVGSNAQIYNVFGSWRWSIDEKTELGASVGPAVIHSEQDDADATDVRNWIPFTRVNGNFTPPPGFVEIDGTPADPNGYSGGVLLISQFTDCPLLQNSTTERVLVSDQSCNPSVVVPLVGPDADLATEIQGATATVNNQNPDGETSTDVTVFADVTLTRHWSPTLHTGLHYTREQGNASGLGGTVVSDSVTLSNTWDITEKWQLAARAEWGLRKSLTEQGQINTLVEELDPTTAFANSPGASTIFIAGLAPGLNGVVTADGESFVQRDDTTDIDTMRWGFASRITRIFTRNTSGYLQFTYNQQGSQNDSLGDPSDFEDYLVTLGVQHVFSPIKLW
ncbi:MAG TPA: hypothetical protein VFY49_06445, partial [Myxococcota bacterium]|nr:hypothetical protein [Myxococcota bacterium]